MQNNTIANKYDEIDISLSPLLLKSTNSIHILNTIFMYN